MCIMIFELHNEMDVNKQLLQCSLHFTFWLQHDQHMQRMKATQIEMGRE